MVIILDEAKFVNELKKINELVCIAEFGSYNTEYWIKDRSDIDLAVVVNHGVSFLDTLDIEDDIIKAAQEYYEYENIHLILDNERWYDFQHYVFKYARLNEKLERTLKIDEQYYYFGEVVDESLL